MNRRSQRHIVLAWVTAVVVVELAAMAPAPPIPPLNQKVLAFASERIGEKVADGQCTSLAAEALRYAGAKRYPFEPSGDFVWGRRVPSFKEALPGDILQFRNAVFQGKRWISKRRWVSWHHEYPHHTAIVQEVREGGRFVEILHQNVGSPDADEATKQIVQKASIRPESLQQGGAVAIYRPVARDEAEKPDIRHNGLFSRRTEVAIRGDSFLINGRPTYDGRSWKGRSIEGLLLNARMVQGIFDDINPQTRSRWAYPDTKLWDPERNTHEFLAAMPLWHDHGLLSFTINLQGGSPQSYSPCRQIWHNSAFTSEGGLRPEYLDRLARILDRADELGMAVILGLFYFGQDERLKDEAAVVRAVDRATAWILDSGYKNVLIEVNNECNIAYDHAILKPERVHELIERIKARKVQGRRLLVGTSYGGGTVPGENVVRSSDFLLMHGNGVGDPARIAAMVREARAVPGYRPMPILFNEDDHFDFDQPSNNLESALSQRVSWGYFDPGSSNYRDGYQSPPVNWGINTKRKRAFFAKLKEITSERSQVDGARSHGWKSEEPNAKHEIRNNKSEEPNPKNQIRRTSWDARGVGPLPRMGVTSLDVSDDGTEIAVGTIAAFGDPNVIVLSDAGKIVRQYKVGQQWIDNVAFVAGTKDVLAICTMPAGKADDHVEIFRCRRDQVIAEKVSQKGPWFFHYGDHSNHPVLKRARAKNATAILAGNQLTVYRKDKAPTALRVPISDPDACVSLAVDGSGWTVVGTTTRESALGSNLHLFNPDQQKPVWSRAANTAVEKAPTLEKGRYGTPTLPLGSRQELPQRDEKVWAPLSVAIHANGGKRLIGAADYQGWQRWVRSSATMKDDNHGLRFMPVKPSITIYDEAGKVVQRVGPDRIEARAWYDLRFDLGGLKLYVWQHYWSCRGLAGMPLLPADDTALGYCVAVGGQAEISKRDRALATLARGTQDAIPFTAPSELGLVRMLPRGDKLITARASGVVTCGDVSKSGPSWRVDLNKEVPRSPKPWVANARARPIVPGVWQLPGGRVESDLGGQCVIEAPDGLILIEGHAGLSFEREWAAMEAAGLDPRRIKYVLATHEHGDHAPGAYLWRVITGAKFICSEEMAYTLQHHIPGNTGYGLHPPVPADVKIAEDTELDLAGLEVRALRIPGHTAGSMAWHFRKGGKTLVAFGDLIMPRGVLGYSGSVNFSATDVLASLRKLRDLKADLVLPGHGAVEGPENYFHAGIDVGQAVGWGLIKPERPDPRFRITQENVLVVGWGQNATSAACGDVNSDGWPDVVVVSPAEDASAVEGSVVKFFLNRNGKFNAEPDSKLTVPQVDQPHKIRVTMTKSGSFILVAGKTAALLTPHAENGEPGVQAKLPAFSIVPFDLADANQLRFIGEESPLVSHRFGGFYALDLPPAKTNPRIYLPAIDGPYADICMFGNDLLTSYGELHRGADVRFPKTPARQLQSAKDWTFLVVGDFNGDEQPDAAFLSNGTDGSTAAYMFYGRNKTTLCFGEKADAVLPLSALLKSTKKNEKHPLVRDTPVAADWNGDGIDDLVVAHGQSDEVLVFLGAKSGLSKDRVGRITLDYRVHYEHGVYVGDFNGDGKPDLAVFGYTNTGVGAGGPPAVYVWLQ
jgi:glyoxylase-like metal-dependent hydrolase (beta-lactamase superfamily II)